MHNSGHYLTKLTLWYQLWHGRGLVVVGLVDTPGSAQLYQTWRAAHTCWTAHRCQWRSWVAGDWEVETFVWERHGDCGVVRYGFR